MSLAPLMRPAARSAAVRPHSSFPCLSARSSAAPRPGCRRPASCAARFFLCYSPRPFGRQSYWLASPGWGPRARGLVTVTPLVTALVTAKSLQSLDNPEPLPSYQQRRAFLMTCARKLRSSLSLSLVTWEQRKLVYSLQWVGALPALFPQAEAVETWEQPAAARARSRRLGADANKIATGYADQQLLSGDAGAKFQASSARAASSWASSSSAGSSCATWSSGNGGNQPLSARLVGHVGTIVLEGSSQGLDAAAETGARLKLGRLRQLPAQAPIGRLDQAPPTPPNADPQRRSVLALDALRISFELGSAPNSSGLFHDGSAPALKKSAQNLGLRWGPGGTGLGKAGLAARPARHGEAGKRAGVTIPLALERGPTKPADRMLRRNCCAVNGGAA